MDAPVAKRNDSPKGVSVYAQSRAHEVSGRDPNAVYEWHSTDPTHPQFAGNKTRPHEIGGPGNYAMCEPWEVVQQGEVIQGKQRADGPRTPYDSAVRNGSMVLLKTTKENRAAYDAVNNNKSEFYARQLSSGVRGGSAGITTKIRGHIGTAETGAENASVNDVLSGV